MSMTIRRAIRFLGAAALVLSIWTAILGALAFAVEPGAPLAVFAPGHAKEIAAIAGGSLETFGDSVAVTRSVEPHYAMRLYKAGALFVIDARVVMSCRSFVAG
jgi:hypothetical protein